jgi:hypothetical protein
MTDNDELKERRILAEENHNLREGLKAIKLECITAKFSNKATPETDSIYRRALMALGEATG